MKRHPATPRRAKPAGVIPVPTVVAVDADIRARASKRRMKASRVDERLTLVGNVEQVVGEALAGEAKEPWTTCGAWSGVDGGNDDRGAAFQLATFGWTDGLNYAREMFKSVRAQKTNSFLAEPVAADEPGDVDVAAYLGDAELQFLGTRSGKDIAYGPGSVVRIQHDLFTSGGCNAADMVQRGLVVAAAAVMIERAGLRCELSGRLYGKGHGGCGSVDLNVKIKAATEPMILSKVLYWLAHPSVLRILLHQIGTLHGNGQDGYYQNYLPQEPGVIQTPGQVLGTELDEWLKQTLNSCGLKVRA